LAAAGSAIGLGNIWKFPRMAYANGGGAFILVYLVIVVLIGATVMLTEFSLGRSFRQNVVGTLRSVNKKFTIVGGMAILTGFIIISYYSHVGGWVVKYFVAYVTNPGAVFADPVNYFLVDVLGMGTDFPVQGAVIFPFIFMAIVAVTVALGVNAGIERLNKVLMPALFVLLIILFFRGVTIPGGGEGLKYLLVPDFSALSGGAILAALGQAFFSLSLGMSIMVTYGSYLPKEDNLVKSTFTVCGLDTLIAFLAGFATIPVAFAAGIEIASGGGAGFAFISLASAFESMPLGGLFGALFYLLLLFAALTSAVSIMEGVIAFVIEQFKVSRVAAVTGISIVTYFIGMLYTVSQACKEIKGIWIDVNGVTNPSLADFMEFCTDKFLMPLGALFTCLVVGWYWGVGKVKEEIETGGHHKFALEGVYSICVKFIAPIAILIIVLGGFGVFG